MLAAGGDRIYETVFYETGGASVSVPSQWFDEKGFALSLSRAAMDQILLRTAENRGAIVMQGASVTKIHQERGSIRGLSLRDDAGTTKDIEANIVVDATGRARVVSRMAEKSKARKEPRPRFVGFKAHMTGAGSPRGVCEIYGFRGGYAGLSFVEDGRSNLCFLAKASLLSGTNDADTVLEDLRDQNRRAAETLADIKKEHDWISVSVPSFGLAQPSKVAGLYTVGDAAAFVDPFTGSGMLMAMESGECLANCIEQLGVDDALLRRAYDRAYRERFASRLKISGLIRRVAYEPSLSWAMVRLLSMSRKMRAAVARRTRSARAADGV